jgi:type IV pilus assembly protein PilA
MRSTSRPRLQGKREGGFTLLELMMVVLIIAILLAIAIPTFLGARRRAQNRSVQHNLRNALTAQKGVYADARAYSSNVSASGPLKTGEPSLTYVANGSMASAVTGRVYVYVPAAGTSVTLGARSASGTCFYLRDVATGAAGVGTFYGQNTTCTAPSATTVTATSWT